jgi:SWI/SNF related-matrix-associated actin-dependent regulator of chromatin subfamily C
VLYPDGALCVPEGEPSAQMRTLAANGPRARVHWRFLPPSYAEWLPAKSAPPPGAERSEPIDGKLPWRVTVRWALDSEQYNEWMHPQDYEADEDKAKSVAEAEAAAALGKATAAAEAGKRSAAAHLEAVQAVPAKRPLSDVEVDAADPGQEVAPGVFKRRVLNVHRPVLEGTMAVENVSQVCPCFFLRVRCGFVFFYARERTKPFQR